MLDRHRFSGARVTDDHHRLAFVDVERESLENFLCAKGFVDVNEADHVENLIPLNGIGIIQPERVS